MPDKTRAILTIATGKPLYPRLAANLFYSFDHNDSGANVSFEIVTDAPSAFPRDVRGRAKLVPIEAGRYGRGFSPKLWLDRLASADETLFIDADCIIVSNTNDIFDRLAGRPVATIGRAISSGEWFGDVPSILQRFRVDALPKFNGGIYYVEPGPKATDVYQTARELEKDYDNLGLVRLRGRPNDELLVSIAMAIHGLEAYPDDGSFLSSPFECPGPMHVDVLRGEATLVNPSAPDPNHRAWYPFHEVHPRIVHFLGDHHRDWLYRREVMRIRASRRGKLAATIARPVSVAIVEWPIRLSAALKNFFRPAYRKLFGPRRLRQSERV